jgi:Pectate lyase superfamily protein
MAIKTLPSINDSNWGTPLNNYITQLTDNTYGGSINTFSQFSQRPTTLTADDKGKTYLYIQTGNLHRWDGTAWKVLNESVVNVKDYGAVGDGVTDDATAIQALVNLGGVVYFPTGKYFCSKAINITKSNTKLCGDYSNSLLIGGTGVSLVAAIGSKITSGTIEQKTANYLDNITLENLSFVSKHVYDITTLLIDLKYIKNSQITNCIFNNITHNGATASVVDLVQFSGFYNCKYVSNIFKGTGNIQSRTNLFGFSGLGDGSVSQNGISTNNICYGIAGNGLILRLACKNVTIISDIYNIFDTTNPSNGIQMYGTANVNISDCQFIGGGKALSLDKSPTSSNQNISLNNNLYENQTMFAIMSTDDNFSLEINGGNIINTAGNGLYVSIQSSLNTSNLKINNLNIDVPKLNKAIFFELIQGHKLVLEESDPNIISGSLLGYIDDTRNIGNKTLGDLKFVQTKPIVITVASASICKVSLDAGFYTIVGSMTSNFTAVGSQLNLLLSLNNPIYAASITNSVYFEKPFIVQNSGLVDFTASIPGNGSTCTINSFFIYRNC